MAGEDGEELAREDMGEMGSSKPYEEEDAEEDGEMDRGCEEEEEEDHENAEGGVEIGVL
jgi:hypothetical protein